MRMWLLQTGTWKTNVEENEEIIGFSHFVNLHYMGAAEYEIKSHCGEMVNPLALSLERIYMNKNDFDFFPMLKRKDALGRQMYVYCRKEQAEEIKKLIREQIKHEYVKRPALLGLYLNKSAEQLEDVTNVRLREFWWDIENDAVIFFGENRKEQIQLVVDTLYEKNKPAEKPSFLKKVRNLFKKAV